MLPLPICLDQATVCFGARSALRNFTGSFAPNTVTALIGGDGAGKSTLLKLLAGRLTLRSGTSAGLSVDRHDVGYQPADSGVWQNLSVAENIEFVAHTFGLTPDRTRARSKELLTRAGLEHVKDRLAGRLSGGMRQKLAVLLATLHEPSLVLLDEPTTGVDPISRAELWSLIGGAAADGATVVLATTYVDEAERATNLFLLDEGSLLAAGTPDEVIASTPGTMWKAPATLDIAQRELSSPYAWRRANTVYRWQSSSDSAPPDGFKSAPSDLENTSIALLLDHEGDFAQTPVRSGDKQDANLIAGHGSKPLIEAVDVTRSYGTFNALESVSLKVKPGEIVGLLGGNGAGKTTLIRILLGLETPTSGMSMLFGESPSLSSLQRIGYVSQGLGLYPSLSGIENLEFAASVYCVPVSEYARAFAQKFGRTPVAALSLGTKRILAYLAASCHEAELLVLDEPTSGMDALARARLWQKLHATADGGTGILVTTHYMEEAAQCDRLVILSEGQVIATGTEAEITAQHTSLTITSKHWEKTFARLREAGLPVLLDGRTLRLPGGDKRQVSALLAPLDIETTINEGVATLEETMLLAARDESTL